MKRQASRSFTATSRGGLLRALETPCQACAAFDPATIPQNQHPKLEKFTAIWDTGATNSVITQRVVDVCGLKPTGMTQVHGIHGPESAETFLVHIQLPNNVEFLYVKVTRGKLISADMLIGMDIITVGDFSITNVGKKTIFSFRVPSLKAVDFVKESQRAAAPKFQPGPPRKKRRRKR